MWSSARAENLDLMRNLQDQEPRVASEVDFVNNFDDVELHEASEPRFHRPILGFGAPRDFGTLISSCVSRRLRLRDSQKLTQLDSDELEIYEIPERWIHTLVSIHIWCVAVLSHRGSARDPKSTRSRSRWLLETVRIPDFIVELTDLELRGGFGSRMQ